MVVSLSVNALIFNEVTLSRARLVLEWLTVCRQLNLLGPTQPDHPSVHIGASLGVNRHTMRCISPVALVLQSKLVYGSD